MATEAVRYAIARLPAAAGVYRFRGDDGTVLYIGRATTLRSRVASYWSDLREREHLTAMVAAVARVEAVACASVHEAAWLERNLLEARKPRWNRTAGGQEVHGWHDGVTVRFGFQAGRLREWTQQARLTCTRSRCASRWSRSGHSNQ